MISIRISYVNNNKSATILHVTRRAWRIDFTSGDEIVIDNNLGAAGLYQFKNE